jgi:hypothetical protein
MLRGTKVFRERGRAAESKIKILSTVTLPECCQESCSSHDNVVTIINILEGSIYHIDRFEHIGGWSKILQTKVWLTPTRTRQAFQVWPKLGINTCVLRALCCDSCLVSVSVLCLLPYYCMHFIYSYLWYKRLVKCMTFWDRNFISATTYWKQSSFRHDSVFE